MDYAYKLANKEDPTRAMTQLRNLARGHALSQARNYLTMEDMPLLIKVVMSTASMERVRILDLLIENDGKLTTSQISKSINISNNSAKRTMAELIAIGLADLGPDVPSEHGSPQKQIVLKNEFNWFISDEFKRKENYPYYSELNNEKEDSDSVRKYANNCIENKKDNENEGLGENRLRYSKQEKPRDTPE